MNTKLNSIEEEVRDKMIHNVDKNTYERIHYWLRKQFGSPTYCEGTNCSGISSYYGWALKKGLEYAFKRENFIRLCKSCHSKYDFTDEGKRRISLSLTGIKHSKERRAKQSKIMQRVANTPEFRKKISDKNSQPVIQLTSKGVFIKEYSSQMMAAKAINIHFSAISQSIIKGYKAGGYYWKHKNG